MVLVSREAWTPKESSRFREFCLSRGFAPVYYPDMPETERNSVIQLQEPVYALGVRELLADPQLFMQGLHLTCNRLPMTGHILNSSWTGTGWTIFERVSAASGKVWLKPACLFPCCLPQ